MICTVGSHGFGIRVWFCDFFCAVCFVLAWGWWQSWAGKTCLSLRVCDSSAIGVVVLDSRGVG